jgi:hypothetical protein
MQAVKVGTPLGEYPFVFQRLERRDGGLAIIGSVAGIESTVVVEPEDLAALAKRAALPLAAVALLVAFTRSR